MGRRKHKQCWDHVTKVENGWICNYCNEEFAGGATRIEAHLGLGGRKGGIKRCDKYSGNNNEEGVHNNIASTSTNPHVHSIQGQGVPHTTSTVINNSINPPTGSVSLSLEGVNGSSCNVSDFISEINHLKQLVLDLECEEKDIIEQLQLLESRGKKRKPEVDDWLEELQKMKESVDDMNNLNGIDAMNGLINKMKRHKKDKPLILSTEFVGRTLVKNIQKVLKLIDDDKVFVIGIYGMGGVGKTLLATLVENEVKRKRTLENVFRVTVSHNFSISKLQHDIAKIIGLKLDNNDDERIRADNLSSALEIKGKSVLILDDVWKYIDLEKVGIHPKVNGIKVILTTRLKHVCHQMDCLPNNMMKIIPLLYIDEYDESWELFMLKLGHNGTLATLSPEIEEIAKCIVKRCDGLPLGINVMARTMKGINDIRQWKHALNKLEKLAMGQEMVEEVFKVLKRSYDNLMEKNLQNCFLYCALTSHFDNKCQKDELIMNLVDNGLINGNGCLKEIFDEGNIILSKLESHSLITSFGSMVYTHSLVIDMACYILKEKKKNVMVKSGNKLIKKTLTHKWTTDLELIHLYGCQEEFDLFGIRFIEEILEDMSPDCPMLSTLIINEMGISHVPESFFKYMNSLSILDLSYNRKLVSLPNSIAKLTSLISLVLKGCDSLEHVPPLGELQALSRLVISYTSIKEVPQGLEKLVNLKWLDLSRNECLESMSFLLNLTKMQYLNLQQTPVMITAEDIQGMNMLECFGGVFDCKHFDLKNKLDIIFGLKAYHLTLANVITLDEESFEWDDIDLDSIVPDYPSTRIVHFADCNHDFSHILPNNLTDLLVNKNHHWVCLCSALSYNSASSLRKITITECPKLESLFCLSCSFCTNIHNLEALILEDLESLTVVWKDVGQSLSLSRIFSCLKELSISYCHFIEKLLTPQLVLLLLNLETISVKGCASMKEIFAVSNNVGNDSSSIALPKLTKLKLWGLPKLKIVCKQRIHCGSSRPALIIDNCENLERHPTVEFIGDDEIPYFGIIP